MDFFNQKPVLRLPARDSVEGHRTVGELIDFVSVPGLGFLIDNFQEKVRTEVTASSSGPAFPIAVEQLRVPFAIPMPTCPLLGAVTAVTVDGNAPSADARLAGSLIQRS